MCLCQECGNKYKVDIIISDELWESIKPKKKPKSGGLLCGKCIFEKIEKLNNYNVFFLKETK